MSNHNGYTAVGLMMGLLAIAGCGAGTSELVPCRKDDSCGLPSTLSPSGQAAVDVLNDMHGATKGSVWNVRKDTQVGPFWLLQTPAPDHWGAPGSELQLAERCANGITSDCDSFFELEFCVTDADCQGGGRCQPVQATVTAPGQSPQHLCVGHSDYMYEEIYNTIIKAERYVDITSLRPPTGAFHAAIRNAITYLSEAGRAVNVRMLWGLQLDKYPTGMDVTHELATMVSGLPADSSVRVWMGVYREHGLSSSLADVTSWNHSKIIAIDDEVLLEGGQNFWHADYLRNAPTHDLSLLMNGGITVDAHNFANVLWDHICEESFLPGVTQSQVFPRELDACPPTYFPENDPVGAAGGVTVIPVGRLGLVGDNPSDDAQIALVRAAKQTVRIAQQDIGPPLVAGLQAGSWPEDLFDAMIEAMVNGATVDLVVSSNGAQPNPQADGYSWGWAIEDIRDEFLDYMVNHPETYEADGRSAEQIMCEQFKLAEIRYNANEDTWPGGEKVGNHSKFIFVDDQSFYVGSHNLYAANLAEYGMIVDDAGLSAQVLGEYWEPLWEASSPAAITAEPCEPGNTDLIQDTFSVAKDQFYRTSVNVPEGTTAVTFHTHGGTGDADLYVQLNDNSAGPGNSLCNGGSFSSGNHEVCELIAPAAGTYHIAALGYSDASNVTLTVGIGFDLDALERELAH